MLHVALTLATKFYLDHFEKFTLFFGIVPGLDRGQMRRMTDYFIDMLDFKLYISQEEYQEAMSHIKKVVRSRYAAQGLLIFCETDLKKKRSEGGGPVRLPLDLSALSTKNQQVYCDSTRS